jgi:hypothetical protein
MKNLKVVQVFAVSLMVVILVVGSILFLRHNGVKGADDARNTNEKINVNTQKPQLFSLETSGDNQNLTLPFINTKLQIPVSLFTLTQSDISTLNDPSENESLACGQVIHTTISNNTFGLSSNGKGPCATYTNYLTFQNDLLNASPQDFCVQVSASEVFTGCTVKTINGRTVAHFWKYIPSTQDFLDTKKGSISENWYTQVTNDSQTRLVMFLIADKPPLNAVDRESWKAIILNLINNKNVEVNNFIDEAEKVNSIFDGGVDSL